MYNRYSHEVTFHKAENRIESLIDILKDYDLESLVSNHHLYEWEKNNASHLPPYIQYAAGASRVVFWDDRYNDFVMKIELEDHTQYCRFESEYYFDAAQIGIEECFAWSDYITSYCGADIFAMQYYQCDECVCSDISSEYQYSKFLEEAEDRGEVYKNDDEAREAFWGSYYCEGSGDHDAIIELVTEQYYTDDVAREFCKFVDDHHINDLHSGNISIVGDKAVFVDYGGF